jgi:hypothetical protein
LDFLFGILTGVAAAILTGLIECKSLIIFIAFVTFDEGGIKAFNVALTAIWVCIQLCSQVQRPYYFNFMKNPFFVTRTGFKKSHQVVFAYGYNWLTRIAPLAMLALLSLVIPNVSFDRCNLTDLKYQDNDKGILFLRCVLIVRAYRWIWQETSSALFQLVIYVWVALYASGFTLDITLGLLVFALIHDRLKDFKGKLHFVLVSIFTSIVSVDGCFINNSSCKENFASNSWAVFICFSSFCFLLFLLSLLHRVLSLPL